MLFYLLYDVLSELEGLGFLRVFRYLSTRILAAAITALVISFLLGPSFSERGSIASCEIASHSCRV